MRSLITVVARGRSARVWIVLLGFAVGLSLAGGVSAQERSLLWRVSRDGKSIYLLGSIHYLRQSNYPLNPTILKTLDASKRLVLEIDLNNTTIESAQKLTIEKAVYRDGSGLSKNVNAETYEMASRRATELGLDMRILEPMKPWFASLTMVAIQLQRMGLDPKFGVDRYLAAQAKSTGKPTAGLETLEHQLSVFDRLSAKEQESMLRETVGELERLDKNINDIVGTWLRGDADELASLLLIGMREYPDLYEKILLERNRRWVGELEKLVGQGSGALVVVGAAHVVGKDSVVELLKAKGYEVEQQ